MLTFLCTCSVSHTWERDFRTRTSADDPSSLVGQQAINDQFAFIAAIPHTKVKLFVPSELGSRPIKQQAKIKALNAKTEVAQAAREANIPTTLIWPGYLAESAFATLYVLAL